MTIDCLLDKESSPPTVYLEAPECLQRKGCEALMTRPVGRLSAKRKKKEKQKRAIVSRVSGVARLAMWMEVWQADCDKLRASLHVDLWCVRCLCGIAVLLL